LNNDRRQLAAEIQSRKAQSQFLDRYFLYSLSCGCAHFVPLSLLPFDTSSITSLLKNSAFAEKHNKTKMFFSLLARFVLNARFLTAVLTPTRRASLVAAGRCTQKLKKLMEQLNLFDEVNPGSFAVVFCSCIMKDQFGV
jgi:hypothetical protein